MSTATALVLSNATTTETPAHDPTLLERVMAYRHPGLIVRMMSKLNIDRDAAEVLFADVKRFLYICGTVSGHWGPAPKLDNGWHEFILFTRDYSDFCKEHFGRYLHHKPNSPTECKDHLRPRRTLEAAKTLFGISALSENWVYPDASGKPVLGPMFDIATDAVNPCDSCGCSPCDG